MTREATSWIATSPPAKSLRGNAAQRDAESAVDAVVDAVVAEAGIADAGIANPGVAACATQGAKARLSPATVAMRARRASAATRVRRRIGRCVFGCCTARLWSGHAEIVARISLHPAITPDSLAPLKNLPTTFSARHRVQVREQVPTRGDRDGA